uniref:Alcohol dehydrogenase-like C-terminal domain-containing protein n=1 Tax=Kalanchoe fedtschenkoi TaxID=63787 RepID=A0A7N0ZV50_KALFE
MALVTHQLQGAFCTAPLKPVSWGKGIKLRQHGVSLRVGSANLRSLNKCNISLSVGVRNFLAKRKTSKISAFKGNAQNDESEVRAGSSKSASHSVKLSYLQQNNEETCAKSLNVHNVPLSYASEGKESVLWLPAVHKLFKKWLTVLVSQSPNRTTEGFLEGEQPETKKPETEKTEIHIVEQEKGRGQVLKACWGYFLGLDTTIKLPLVIFCLQLARAFGASDIIAVDIQDDKLEKAKIFGATHTVNSAKEDAVEKIREITGGLGVDIAVEALGRPQTFQQCSLSVRDGGKAVMIGLAKAGSIGEVDINRLVRRQIKVIGSYGGRARQDLPKLVRLAESGVFNLNSALLCLQLARAFGASDIIAVDIQDDKLEKAKIFGATHTVNSAKEDAVEKIREITGGLGVDIAVEALGRPQTFQQCSLSVRDGGKAVMIGLAKAGSIGEVDINRLVRRQIKVIGSYGGRARQDLPKLSHSHLRALLLNIDDY